MFRHYYSSLMGSIAFAVACGGTQGARPHDMSESEHQVAARQEEKAAESHSADYAPGATEETTTCSKGQICWTSQTNPTEEHRKEAERHHKAASDHRAGAQVLRDAEARACAGLPEADRDTSPFYHRDDIAEIKPLIEEVPVGKAKAKKTIGAEVVFRAVPGMTAEWLQRLVDCHQARAASVGFTMPEMDYCPLMLKDVKAKVVSTGTGFGAQLTSGDAKTAEQILERAQALSVRR